MAGPLQDTKILDFTRYQQGPSATVMLAEMGAEVLKVEPPGGDPGRRMSLFEDGFSGYFEPLNRGKKSIVVNLRQPAGREVIFRLVKQVDVLVENFRPGVMDRLGVGYEALSPLNPSLIYASASMYGPEGPRANYPGFDTIAQAAGGMLMATRRPGDEVGTPLPGTADQVGGMTLALGILGALVHRQRTGEGQKVDVSLFGSQLSLQMLPAARAFYEGVPLTSPLSSGRITGHLRCGDGRLISFGYLNAPQWKDTLVAFGLGEVAEDPRFATPEERAENMPELMRMIRELVATQDSVHWLERLVEADIPCTLTQDYDMLAEDPQALANDYIYSYEHPRFGTLKAVGPVASFSETGSNLQGPAPLDPGQDTDSILDRAGYTAQEVEQLRAAGAVS